jgi:hypothetical protein
MPIASEKWIKQYLLVRNIEAITVTPYEKDRLYFIINTTQGRCFIMPKVGGKDALDAIVFMNKMMG